MVDKKVTKETIKWTELGFAYIDTGASYRAYYENGKWSDGEIVSEGTVTMSQASPVLHYGQAVFEGLKAYRTKNGDVQLFRPDENAKRMKRSAERLHMTPFPEDRFIKAVHKVVQANADWIPPYGTEATLYIRPFLYGTGDVLGVSPAPSYTFGIYVSPVGPYFKGGLKPANFMVSEYDRAAPNGTGGAKTGGNYASSLLAGKEAREKGFADAIYLDPATHTKIEEVGAANFFGITQDGTFITPKSPSILPSITKYSLLYLAEKRLGLEAVEGDIFIDRLEEFTEAGAMGTAAVITPIGSITYKDKKHIFGSETKVGPVVRRLYNELVGIQFGDVEAPEGWIQKVEW